MIILNALLQITLRLRLRFRSHLIVLMFRQEQFSAAASGYLLVCFMNTVEPQNNIFYQVGLEYSGRIGTLGWTVFESGKTFWAYVLMHHLYCVIHHVYCVVWFTHFFPLLLVHSIKESNSQDSLVFLLLWDICFSCIRYSGCLVYYVFPKHSLVMSFH